jgi:RNA polymerase sigma factor for flagellar operon FliA
MGDLQLLWKSYAAARSDGADCPAARELRRQLIEAYVPLTRYVVDRMNLNPGSGLGYEDLLSQAVVGLIDAVDRFDPERGIKFETYAYHRIRGAVMDLLRELDWLPRSVRQRESEVASAYARLQTELGRPPSDQELAAALQLTLDELDRIAQQVALQSIQSLDQVISGARSQGWEEDTFCDCVADHHSITPEEQVEQWAERDLLVKAIEALPESERTVVSLYYHEGLTLKEIGEVLGVTESRVCQIHGKALLRLRAQLQPLVAGVP